MTLHEAIAETMRRAEKDQEFLRRTLEKRRKEAELDATQVQGQTQEQPAPPQSANGRR